mgnify:CR=1 FL=1
MRGFFPCKKDTVLRNFFVVIDNFFNVYFVNLLLVNVEMHKYTFLFMCKYPKCEKSKKMLCYSSYIVLK